MTLRPNPKTKGKKPRDESLLMCFNCKQRGHIKKNCPEPRKSTKSKKSGSSSKASDQTSNQGDGSSKCGESLHKAMEKLDMGAPTSPEAEHPPQNTTDETIPVIGESQPIDAPESQIEDGDAAMEEADYGPDDSGDESFPPPIEVELAPSADAPSSTDSLEY